MRKSIICSCATVLLLAGCQDATQQKTQEKAIDDLKATVADLSAKVERLENMTIETRFALFEAYAGEATLDPSSREFLPIDSSVGRFFVRIKSIEPYLTGHKVILEVGNPSATTYGNAKLKLTWGPKLSSGDIMASQEMRGKTERSKEFTPPGNFLPGSWTPIDVILDDTAANQLGYIGLKIDFRSVRLAR